MINMMTAPNGHDRISLFSKGIFEAAAPGLAEYLDQRSAYAISAMLIFDQG